MNQPPMRSAPAFRNACVVLFGANLTIFLFIVWAIWGLIVAIAVSLGINRLITWLQGWAARRAAARIKRGKTF